MPRDVTLCTWEEESHSVCVADAWPSPAPSNPLAIAWETGHQEQRFFPVCGKTISAVKPSAPSEQPGQVSRCKTIAN